MKTTLTALLAICLCWAAGCGKGEPAADKPLPKDFESLKALAEQGDAKAQTSLGVMYYSGEGVPQDFKEAVKWLRKAADQGHAWAQYTLGLMHYNGEGVPQDKVTTYAWWNIAAANGNATAKQWKDIVAKKMTADQIAKADALSTAMLKKNPKLLK